MGNRTTEESNIYLDTFSSDVDLGRIAPRIIIFAGSAAGDKIVFTDYANNPLFELRISANNGVDKLYFPKGRFFDKLRVDVSAGTFNTDRCYIIQ